jgi:hypothetical protein
VKLSVYILGYTVCSVDKSLCTLCRLHVYSGKFDNGHITFSGQDRVYSNTSNDFGSNNASRRLMNKNACLLYKRNKHLSGKKGMVSGKEMFKVTVSRFFFYPNDFSLF